MSLHAIFETLNLAGNLRHRPEKNIVCANKKILHDRIRQKIPAQKNTSQENISHITKPSMQDNSMSIQGMFIDAITPHEINTTRPTGETSLEILDK